jgi:tetratricopeptide (TPR) repeat protein
VYHLLNEDYQQAITYFDNALEISPDFGPAKVNRLIAEARNSIKIFAQQSAEYDEDQLVAIMEERLRSEGYNISLDLTKIRDFGSGQTTPVLKDPHQNFPELRDRAMKTAETGNYAEAILPLRQIVRNVPSDHDSWYMLAVCLDETGQHEEALSCFDQALEHYPSNYVSIETLNSKGEALRKLGRLDEAIALYDEVLKHQPNHEFALNNKGICLKDLGRFDEARLVYHQALAAHPDSWRVLGNLGQLEARLGNQKSALECCDRLSNLPNKNVAVHICSCVIYSQLGQTSELQAELERVRALDPTHPILSAFDAPPPKGKIPLGGSSQMMSSVRLHLSDDEKPGDHLRQQLEKQCEKRIAVYDANTFKANLPDLEGATISFTQLTSFQKIGTVFTLHIVHIHDGGIETESHVTDFQQGGQIVHIVTHGKGEVFLILMTEPIIDIIEIDGPDEVWCRSIIEQLAKTESTGARFLYCHSNPVLVLDHLLDEGSVIEWCAVVVAYQEGGVRAEHGVQVCFFWINAVTFPLFLVSDNVVTKAIERFCDEYIADETRFRRITAEELLQRISSEDQSRFLDHAVFQYYLCGKTATEALAEVRRPYPD